MPQYYQGTDGQWHKYPPPTPPGVNPRDFVSVGCIPTGQLTRLLRNVRAHFPGITLRVQPTTGDRYDIAVQGELLRPELAGQVEMFLDGWRAAQDE